MKMKHWFLGGVLALIASAVLAQSIVAPQVQNVGPTDLIQVIPKGQPVVGNVYATAGMVNGVIGTSYQVPLTAFSITVPNGISALYLNPAGTLATGTVIMMPNPGDGQQFILESTQTQTAITMTANTGQTLSSTTIGLATPTALVANTRYIWTYNASLATWIRTF